jgi:hypothetical protein
MKIMPIVHAALVALHSPAPAYPPTGRDSDRDQPTCMLVFSDGAPTASAAFGCSLKSSPA